MAMDTEGRLVWRRASRRLDRARRLAELTRRELAGVDGADGPGSFLCDVALAANDLADLAMEAGMKAKEGAADGADS